jgi:hypothetical protein
MISSHPFKTFSTLILLAVIAAACAPAVTPQPTPDMQAALTQAVATIQAGGTQTAEYIPPTVLPTETPIPAPTAVRTPPALPAGFTSSLLNPLDTPHTYVQDTCQMLKAKWDPNNAAPGTVVMPIMFHSITKGEVTQDSQINITDFRKLMNDLHQMGFEAIDMQQAADFLNQNAKIPQRSVLLIVDDRKAREYFDKTFKNFYDEWGWKVVNAYITKDERPELWQDNAALEAEGWVDHQAHGYFHNENITAASNEDYMRQELGKPFEMFQKYFNKTPIAYIWPGGSFTPRAVQIAREYKYQLGFTVNPRGPVMYNWVPQSDTEDPMRPSFIPEGASGDPLLTLPRYWDTDARSHIDTVRNLSDAAAAYAAEVKPTELEYYDIVCAPTYGALP